MNRRKFVENSSIASLGIMSSAYLPKLKQKEKIKIGVLGYGWFGMRLVKALMRVGGAEIIAVCDIDAEHLQNGADEIEQLQGSRPRAYKNYLELLEQDGLQAILLATPPHWHALQFIAACKKGLDIYCEKPLAYDINEGLAMIMAAKQAGNVVQIGFLQRNNVVLERAKSLIRSGRLGAIHQIDARIHYQPNVGDHTIQSPPPSLDWETWCGPAPKLPYRPSIGHFNWRLEKEYGNGHLVDWGIHHVDFVRKIMDFGTPKSVVANGSNVAHQGKITTPDTLYVKMDFEECPLIWQHRMWGVGELDRNLNSGFTFYGEDATMFGTYQKLIIQPKGKDSKQEIIEAPTKGVLDMNLSNFLAVVQSRDHSQLINPIYDGFQTTATVQLAMMAYYTEGLVKWDDQNNTILENEQAAKLLERPYRAQYKRPNF
ncbi:MAG: Gfo/Idh/MocA family oxidoreductase [Bacteroidota bacterium]